MQIISRIELSHSTTFQEFQARGFFKLEPSQQDVFNMRMLTRDNSCNAKVEKRKKELPSSTQFDFRMSSEGID
jgi:hypothetical protein